MPVSIITVDAFTDAPFGGNPAAVCLLSSPQPDEWMQAVAREMNLSETAFAFPEGDAYRLRWFTPVAEVDLCGHATLAAAHVLWEQALADKKNAVVFNTASGSLACRLRGGGEIEMNFPAEPVAKIRSPRGLAKALGAKPRQTFANRMDVLALMESEQQVRELMPSLSGLAGLIVGSDEPRPPRGVIVTAQADAGADYDFVSRFFAPGVGVGEDPVTGSAHCALGPFWAERLDKNELTGYQASARGGRVGVVHKDPRVTLVGTAVTMMHCQLQHDAL
jgi:PhzF family phenazine biosynthesis protein